MADFTDLGDETVREFADGPSGETVERRRFGPATVVNRHLAEPAPVATPDLRVFAPPTANRTRRELVGSSKTGELVAFSVDDWRSADEATGARGDQLVRSDGSIWSVERVEDYRVQAGFLVIYAALERSA